MMVEAKRIISEKNISSEGKDGKPLSTKILTSPTAKIAFIASGNHKMIENLFTIYKQAEKNTRKDEGR